MDNRNVPEEIKAQLSIEQVVSSYLPLKKAGRIYKALCPFHSEKTPSFTVNPERGIYKCFGCNEGGDAFDFVMKIEGLTFPEAVRVLADRAGIQIEEWQPKGKPADGNEISKSRIYDLNAYTAKLWHTILAKHPKAEAARSYLKSRGLKAETIADFHIGYAPFGTVTAEALRKEKFSSAEIRAAGDPTRFQDRIVFPITDLTGKVIGFTGRLLEHKDDPRGTASRGPKYWNTPETPVFVKSRAVFALHIAKRAIQEENLAILAEGQMDVVMLHQSGYPTAIASSGTALTVEQLKLIKRFTDTVAFAYDQDKAGIEATKRGLELALETELNPYVIVTPSGKDPADCLLKEPESWKKAYEERVHYMEWLIGTVMGTESGALSSEKKKRHAKELLNWVARVQDVTEQADWFRRLSSKLQTSEENLRELFRRLHPSQQVSTSNEVAPRRAAQGQMRLADTALAILLTFPEVFPAVSHQIDTLLLGNPSAKLRKMVGIIRQAPENMPLAGFLEQHLSDKELKELALENETLLQPYNDFELSSTWAISELTLILQRLRSESREEEKSRIADAIRTAQELGDAKRVRELFLELQKLV